MEILFDRNTFLYKRMKSNMFDLRKTTPIWFALNTDVLESYGPNMHILNTKKPLRLLDIMSWVFRLDFMTKMNNYFRGTDITNENVKRRKSLCMIALGIPNIDVQYNMMKKYMASPPPIILDLDMIVDTSSYMGHRLSDKTIDKEMADLLKELYGNSYDGYIQQYRIASCWMNGFPPEVCLFNIAKCDLDIVTRGGKTKKIKSPKMKLSVGGVNDEKMNDVWYHKMNDTMYDDAWQKKRNAENRLLLRLDGYTNKEIDELISDNSIIMPSLEERVAKSKLLVIEPAKRVLLDQERLQIEKDIPQNKIIWKK